MSVSYKPFSILIAFYRNAERMEKKAQPLEYHSKLIEHEPASSIFSVLNHFDPNKTQLLAKKADPTSLRPSSWHRLSYACVTLRCV
jgi:hypothetical protein